VHHDYAGQRTRRAERAYHVQRQIVDYPNPAVDARVGPRDHEPTRDGGENGDDTEPDGDRSTRHTVKLVDR
jgi:hypothetical protein